MGMTRLERLLSLPIGYYPLAFLVVGLAVLFLRVDDPHAWLLAVLFGSFLAGGPLFEAAIPPHLRGFAVGLQNCDALALGGAVLPLLRGISIAVSV
jgi:hypothetical protein